LLQARQRQQGGVQGDSQTSAEGGAVTDNDHEDDQDDHHASLRLYEGGQRQQSRLPDRGQGEPDWQGARRGQEDDHDGDDDGRLREMV
jgi:hypothetical protein